MSKQTTIPFQSTTQSSQTAMSHQAHTPTTATSSTVASSLSSKDQRRKRNYIEVNLEQLYGWFGGPQEQESKIHSSSSPTTSSSTTSATQPQPIDRDQITGIYHSLNDDFQKSIDSLVELTGLHPELRSDYKGQKSQNEYTSNKDDGNGDEDVTFSSSTSSSDSAHKKHRSGRLKFEEKKGDLFGCEPESALAHCISTDIAMGKGIATLFKTKFGGVAELKAQNKQVGEVAILKRDGRFIYYLITKPKYWDKPTYTSLENSLTAMRDHMMKNRVKLLSMPRIGCGLDGLLWTKVVDLIKRVFAEVDCRIVIYSM